MKNMATTMPICLRYCLRIKVVVIREIPKVISTMPEATTTKSPFKGNQVGTWARNSVRFDPRWEMPAEVRNAPSESSSSFFIKVNTSLVLL